MENLEALVRTLVQGNASGVLSAADVVQELNDWCDRKERQHA